MGIDKEMTATMNKRNDDSFRDVDLLRKATVSERVVNLHYSSHFRNEKWIVKVSYISTKCSTYIKWDVCSLTGLNQGSYQNDSST